jgi:hypothetical protein
MLLSTGWAAAVSAGVPGDGASGPASWRDLGPSPVDGIRVGLEVETVRRTLEVDGGASPVLFEAPFYPGLKLRLDLLPVAWFAPSSRLSGLALSFETSKHDLDTRTEVPDGQSTRTISIPTRHDASWFGASYPFSPLRELNITPSLGWRSVEFALGGNPIYTSSFYQGVTVGLAADWLAGPGLSLGGTVELRPAVDMGSTAAAFGGDPDVLGWGAGLEAAWAFDPQLKLRGAARYERYSGSFSAPAEGTGEGAELVDGVTSFVVGLGWSY